MRAANPARVIDVLCGQGKPAEETLMTRRVPFQGIIVALAVLAAAATIAIVPASTPMAHAANVPPDLTAVHRLSIEFFGYALDDPDGIPIGVFRPPPADPTHGGGPPTGTLTRIVDMTVVGGSLGGALHDPNGLRRAWWRGPFVDGNGLGALPTDDDAALCFKDQAAYFSVSNDNRITVRTEVGLAVGQPHCQSDDVVDEAVVMVTAPPDGQRVCSDRIALADDGDAGAAKLCVTNDRIDPRPRVTTTGQRVGAAPLTLHFDASASIVPDGAAEWYWNFGDGVSSTAGPIVSHTYVTTGRYTISLRITDVNGLVRSTVVTAVDVKTPYQPPVARITAGGPYQVGPVDLSALGSTPGNGPHARIDEYRWDFGDGPVRAVTSIALVTHVYSRPGRNTVSVTISTPTGAKATASTTLLILPSPAPTCSPVPPSTPGGFTRCGP
jgi:hypothetical protein